MRLKFNPQTPLEFGPSHLKVTKAYYEKYQAINNILLANPGILEAFHRDVSRPLRKLKRKRRAAFTSDQVLRMILVMEIEGLPYRETVVRMIVWICAVNSFDEDIQ